MKDEGRYYKFMCGVNRADQMVPYYHAAENSAMDQGIFFFCTTDGCTTNTPQTKIKKSRTITFKNFVLGSIQRIKDLAQKEMRILALTPTALDNTTMQMMAGGRSR